MLRNQAQNFLQNHCTVGAWLRHTDRRSCPKASPSARLTPAVPCMVPCAIFIYLYLFIATQQKDQRSLTLSVLKYKKWKAH